MIGSNRVCRRLEESIPNWPSIWICSVVADKKSCTRSRSKVTRFSEIVPRSRNHASWPWSRAPQSESSWPALLEEIDERGHAAGADSLDPGSASTRHGVFRVQRDHPEVSEKFLLCIPCPAAPQAPSAMRRLRLHASL